MANEQHLTIGVGVDLTALRRGIASINSSVSKLGQQVAQSFSQSQNSVARSFAATTTEALRQQKLLAQISATNERSSQQQAKAIQDAAISAQKAKEAESRAIIASESAKLATLRASLAEEKSIQKQRRAEIKATNDSLKQLADQARAGTPDLIKTAQGTLKQNEKEGPAGSYRNLAYQTTELRKRLLTLPGAFDSVTGAINKNNAQAVAWQQQILQNTRALQKADQQLGSYNRNVGNYGSALQGGLRGASMFAASVFGISTAWDALAGTVRTIAVMERQQFALRNASSSAAEYASNLSLATRIALDTGAPLESTTDALRKFTGATRGTSIEGEKARRIFKAFSNTFTSNGASAEEFTRATKALSDMMSKGTVSAEELKGQLGDALPGAVKLFADAIGVSQRELLKMMANGEILAEDILPKVAAQLEKTAGSNAQRNLETISGSWERLTTTVKLFIASFNEGDGPITSFFATINKGLSETFLGLSRVNSIMNQQRNKQAGIFSWFAGASDSRQIQFIKANYTEIKRQEANVAQLQKQYAKSGSDADQLRLESAQAYLRNLRFGYKELQRIASISPTASLGQKTDKTSADSIVKSIRAQIDSIPNALIGENGKAELTKDQSKALRGLRDELLGLYSTLNKGDIARLNLERLKKELNDLLFGEKKTKPKGTIPVAIDNLIYDAERQVKEAQKQIEEAEKILNRPSTQTTSKNRYTISQEYQIEGLKSLAQVSAETAAAVAKNLPEAQKGWQKYGESIVMNLGFARDAVMGVGNAFAESLGGALDSLLSDQKVTFKSFVQSIADGLRQMVTRLLATVVAAELLNLALGGLGKLGVVGLKGFGGKEGFKAASSLLGLNFAAAKGGIVNGPQVGLVGEAGPEAIIPLNRLHEFINPKQGYAPQGGITNQPIVSYVTTVLQVDGERWAVNTERHLAKRQRFA